MERKKERSIRKLDDSLAWQKARELTHMLYEKTAGDSFRRDPILRDQVRQSAATLMGDIAQGLERHGQEELMLALTQAQGSLGRVKSNLYIALDAGHLHKDDFDVLQDASTRVARLLGGFLRALRNPNPDKTGRREPREATMATA